MKKIILLIILAIGTLNLRAENYDDFLSREKIGVDNYMSGKERCRKNLQQSLASFIEYSQCMQIVTLRYSSESSIPTIRGSMGVLNFLWKQKENLDRDVMQKKVSFNAAMESSNSISEQIKREETYAFESGLADAKAITEREAALNASQRMLSAIRAFGGIVQSTSIDRTTYIFNGEIINCTTIKSVISCNR